MSCVWIGDTLTSDDWDVPDSERGNAWIIREDGYYPEIQRPIGFRLTPMQKKPRIRIRAWTRPILPET